MFGIGHFRGQPNEFVIVHVGGKTRRRGPALTFFYLKHVTSIVVVPTNSLDTNFVFNETTRDYQAVTLQGQFTYRIADPETAASLLNFTINPKTRAYQSDDHERLAQRLRNAIQIQARSEVETRPLEEILRQTQAITGRVLESVRASEALGALGVELLALHILAAKPKPEVAKALEAEHREMLLRRADEAIHARRAAAVQDERAIKESELATEISLEEQRQRLIEQQGANAIEEAQTRGRAFEAEAEHRARALEKQLAVQKDVDPRVLLALGIQQMGENAERIGNLTITSEVLSALLDARPPEE